MDVCYQSIAAYLIAQFIGEGKWRTHLSSVRSSSSSVFGRMSRSHAFPISTCWLALDTGGH